MSDHGFRVLVTGGRGYGNAFAVNRALDSVRDQHGQLCVIHGGASGADALADAWGRRVGANLLVFTAQWRSLGRRAGPLRNQRMIDEGRPQLVLAFPGGRGTMDMVRRAHMARIPIEHCGYDEPYHAAKSVPNEPATPAGEP